MADLIYFCVQDGNDCIKKEECKRYVESSNDKNKATLFKAACIEENNYQLFIETLSAKTTKHAKTYHDGAKEESE